MAHILAVSVGAIVPLAEAGDKVLSAIHKQPVSTREAPHAIAVHALGLAGDAQADRRVHGGPQQAVYLYPFEHYGVWQTMRMQALKVEEVLPFGFMGENLTIAGLNETQIWIGDQLHIGDADTGVVLVATRPRAPCFKFNLRMGFKHAAKMMVQSGYTGWYAAVMREGEIKAGDAIRIVPGERLVRIDEKHRLDTENGQMPLI